MRLLSISAYSGFASSRTSPKPLMPWLVSVRTIGLLNGTPSSTTTRTSVMLRLLGREFLLTLLVAWATWSSTGDITIDPSATPLVPIAAFLRNRRRLEFGVGLLAEASLL